MKEFIISETKKIFIKGIKKFAKEKGVEPETIAIMMLLVDEEDTYKVLLNDQPVQDVTLREILGIKVIDLKGYTVMVPPHIIRLLTDLQTEHETTAIDVCAYLDKNDEDEVRFFLYKAGVFVKEIKIEDLIKE